MKVDKKILLKQFVFHDGVTLRFHNCGRDSKMNLHNQEVGSPMQRMHFPPTKTMHAFFQLFFSAILPQYPPIVKQN